MKTWKCFIHGECSLAKLEGIACCVGCPDYAKEPEPLQFHVTIGITTYLRPRSLERLLRSLEAFYPGWTIDVEDTGGNLSAGRNRLVERCQTPYFLLLEDDFEVTGESRIESLASVLQTDSDVGVVCGGLRHKPWDKIDAYATNLRLHRGRMEVSDSREDWETTGRAIYRKCDMGYNFFLARTQVLRDCPWDEHLELHEHAAWFWDLKQQGRWRVSYSPGCVAWHWKDRPSEEYSQQRSRTKKFTPVLQERYGFSKVGYDPDPAPPAKPNVIVLGVGNSNTTITTRQLEALGWNLGDADEQFAESESVRACNHELPIGEEFSEAAAKKAAKALDALPQPWAIKDPRFCDRMASWLPLLAPYKPLLLWVEKDRAAVAESFRRRGAPTTAIDRRQQSAQRVYDAYPWAKLRINAGDIAAAVSLFDLERTPCPNTE